MPVDNKQRTAAATEAMRRKKSERLARELIARGWEVRCPEDTTKPWTPPAPRY